MDTVQKQRELIEKLVKNNNKFSGNEDLFEDFCSLRCELLYVIT